MNDDRPGELLEHTARAFARGDPFWPAQVTVAVAIVLGLDLPASLTIHPGWLLPAFEGALLVGLVASSPRTGTHRPAHRGIALALVSCVTATNLINLGLLIHTLLNRGTDNAHALILAGVEIWITNVLLFTVWYWELDRGGPMGRARDPLPAPDFLFVQMTDDRLGGLDWRAGYVDYLYTSFTNATAFSPTDTMPLTARAKVLMLIQSLASLTTLGLVVARAVNIL